MSATRSSLRFGPHSSAARAASGLAVLLLLVGCGAPAEESAGSAVVADDSQTVKTATLHLVFEDAVFRSPLPGVDKTVGYVTVRNVGANDVVLTGAESESLRALELHTMIRDGDMMRMRRLSEVSVPAGESIAFERGGKHLMAFGVEALSESSEVVFITANDEHLPVRFATVAVTDG